MSTHFSGWVEDLNTVIPTTGSTGNAFEGGRLPGTYCAVYDSGAKTLASIELPTGTARVNPFPVNADGSFNFYGTASTYDLIFQLGPALTTTATPQTTTFVSMVNVLTYGAVGDGTTDDFAAFQAAINAVGLAGIVFAPYTGASYVLSADLSWATGLSILFVLAPGVQISGLGHLPLPVRGNHVLQLAALNIDHSGLGGDDTLIGVNAGVNNTTGFSLTLVGYNAGAGNVSGFSNTCMGTQAGAANVAGNYNVYLGSFAGEQEQGTANAYLGYKAGWVSSSGERDTYVGNSAGFDAVSGDDNVCLGYNAGDGLTTGDGNVAVGSGSLADASTSRSVAIGYQAHVTGNDAIAIGASVTAATQTAVIGDNAVTALGFGGAPSSLGSGGRVIHAVGGASGGGFQGSGTSITSGDPVGYLDFGTTGTVGGEKRAGAIQAVLEADSTTAVTGGVRMYTTNAGVLSENFRLTADRGLAIPDGVTAPATVTGMAVVYVDVSDGDLKIKFGDGTVKTIVTDT